MKTHFQPDIHSPASGCVYSFPAVRSSRVFLLFAAAVLAGISSMVFSSEIPVAISISTAPGAQDKQRSGEHPKETVSRIIFSQEDFTASTLSQKFLTTALSSMKSQSGEAPFEESVPTEALIKTPSRAKASLRNKSSATRSSDKPSSRQIPSREALLKELIQQETAANANETPSREAFLKETLLKELLLKERLQKEERQKQEAEERRLEEDRRREKERLREKFQSVTTSEESSSLHSNAPVPETGSNEQRSDTTLAKEQGGMKTPAQETISEEASSNATSPDAASAPRSSGKTRVVSVTHALEAAQSRFNRGDYVSALESLEPALESSPQYIPLWRLKAKIHYAEGDHEAADEAVQVCLASKVDSETAILAFRNIMEWPDMSSGEKISRYADMTMSIDFDVFADVLSALVLRYGDFSGASADLAAAWRKCGLQPGVAAEIVEQFSRRETDAAMRRLAQPGTEEELGRLAGPLNYLIGKRLLFAGKTEEALPRLERARLRDFAIGETSSLSARIMNLKGQSSLGAQTLASGWRYAHNPGNAAIHAIEALIGAGDTETALSLADSALAAFPRLPGLQARRLLLLHILKKADEAHRYEQLLQDRQYIPGLSYGKILIARHDGERIDVRRELDAIVDFVNVRLGYNLEFESVENWLEYGPRSMDLTARQEARRLMTLGREFWDAGNREDALAVWDESIGYAQPGATASLMTTAAFLTNEDVPSAALDLLERHAPSGFNPMDLAATLAEQKRWTGVKAIFDRYSPSRMNPGSWPALLNAVANVNQGSLREAQSAVAELALHPIEENPLFYRYLDAQGKWRIREMSLKQHQKLRKDIETLAIQRHYTDLYPIFLSSPQWRHDRQGDDPLYTFGSAMLKSGEYDPARSLFSAVLAKEPYNPDANLFMALIELRSGNKALSRKYVSAGLKKAKGYPRARLLSLQSRDREDRESETAHLLECLRLNPEDDEARLEAVRALAAGHRYLDARKVLSYFEKKQRRDEDVISNLALSYVEVGEYAKALEKWKWLVVRYPDSLPPLAGLGVTLNYLEEFEKTIDALSAKARETENQELCSLTAEACAALGRYEEVVTWVDLGLIKEPENLRLLGLGATAAEALERDDLMEDYAFRYISIDFESPPMQGIYGQSLVNQEKWECVQRHNAEILEKNGMNWSALEREFARTNARTDRDMMRDVYTVDRGIVSCFDNDPSLVLRYAISAAGAAEFKKSFCTLYEMVGHGPNSTVISLYFSRISLVDNRGAVKLDKVKAVLDTLTSTPAYRYAQVSDLGKTMPGCKEDTCPVPVLPIFGNSKPEALLELDAFLQSRGGRACLVIGEEALTQKTPGLADVDFLLRLADTGRWQFILTDNRPEKLPGRIEDERTDFWTQIAWTGTRRETAREMRDRLKNEVERLLQIAEEARIPISAWLHPSWGDYGQRQITGDPQGATVYKSVISKAFPVSFTQTPSGYFVPGGNCWRVPMRVIGSTVDPVLLEETLRYGHPTRRGVLELAKVKSWHMQFTKAHELFCLARTYGLNPKEISYFQSRNSQFAGDVPVAIDVSHEARAFDPGAERVDKLISDTHRLLRPLLVAAPRYWTDSNDDAYAEAVATLSFHVTKKLELRIRAGVHRWKNGQDDRTMNGQSLGVGFRYYFKPLHYIQADIRGVNVGGEGKNYMEVDAYWHGRYTFDRLCADGSFNLEYHREGIESYRAQREAIRANRFALNTSTRVADRWDIDMNMYYINRTDGNNTVGMLFRPMYRFSDRPEFRFGYWFAAADSDHNPDEYYAPVRYMAHQAVATYQHQVTKKFAVNALGSIGKAKTETTSWRTVLRGNIGFSYQFNDCIRFSGGYQYLKLPDYTLKQYGASLDVRF